MFNIRLDDNGDILLSGRLDASQVDKAGVVMDEITESKVIDLSDLEYISSAGMGLFLKVHRRLSDKNHKLTLKNLNKHIADVFHYAGFDKIFKII